MLSGDSNLYRREMDVVRMVHLGAASPALSSSRLLPAAHSDLPPPPSPQASTREIFLLLMLIAVGTLIFSTLIYFAEMNQEDDFNNIPIGFWWSIVTMTTVGYGDKIPKSAWG